MPSLTVAPALVALLREPHAAAGLASRTAGGWEPILRDAASHGLASWLYRSLDRAGVLAELPADVVDRLRQLCRAVAARNMLLAAELADVLRACEAQGVPCVPVRGPALAERLYGDITARPMGDLDVLVHRDDLARVASVLCDRGFQELSHRSEFARMFSYTLVFVKQRHGWVIVEPHWTIAYPPFVDRVDMTAVWAGCVRTHVVGVESWSLGREDLLLHLCLHLMHPDEYVPLLWVAELDLLLRREGNELDWSRFLATARAARLGFLLAHALDRVRQLFGTPVPAGVFDELAHPAPGAIEQRVMRLLADDARPDGREQVATLLALPSARLRLRYVLGLLFPSPQFLRTRAGVSGSARLAVAYPQRWCRLAWRAARALAKLRS